MTTDTLRNEPVTTVFTDRVKPTRPMNTKPGPRASTATSSNYQIFWVASTVSALQHWV